MIFPCQAVRLCKYCPTPPTKHNICDINSNKKSLQNVTPILQICDNYFFFLVTYLRNEVVYVYVVTKLYMNQLFWGTFS